MGPTLSGRREQGSRLERDPLEGVAELIPHHKVAAAASQPQRGGELKRLMIANTSNPAACREHSGLLLPYVRRPLRPGKERMRVVFAIAVLCGSIGVPASAQTPAAQAPSAGQPAQTSQEHMPSAIKLENPELGAKEPSGLTPGANSFAEGQAKALIESKGYDNVSALVNDSQGIWHGTATKGQAKVHVSVDYKGHVNAH
jgi:hypothetical protein